MCVALSYGVFLCSQQCGVGALQAGRGVYFCDLHLSNIKSRNATKSPKYRLGIARCAVGHCGGALLTDSHVVLKSYRKEWSDKGSVHGGNSRQSPVVSVSPKEGL